MIDVTPEADLQILHSGQNAFVCLSSGTRSGQDVVELRRTQLQSDLRQLQLLETSNWCSGPWALKFIVHAAALRGEVHDQCALSMQSQHAGSAVQK